MVLDVRSVAISCAGCARMVKSSQKRLKAHVSSFELWGKRCTYRLWIATAKDQTWGLSKSR
eukprot:4037673-Amphidinium_carterae.1